MILYSEKELDFKKSNVIELQGKDGGFYYISKDVYEQAIKLNQKVENNISIAKTILGVGMEQNVYWRVQDDLLWEMRVKSNAYQNYLHHTTSAEFAPNPADNAIPHNTVRLSHAHFLKISTSTIVLGQ